MKFSASELQVNTLKEGLKLTVYIDKEGRKKVLERIHNFIDMPLLIDMGIDSPKREQQLGQISPGQRKKIYAIFQNIDQYSGQGVDSIKSEMKSQFMNEAGVDYFSLSDCPRELAGDFIEYLVEFCFQHGIELKEHPAEIIDDIESYMQICLKKKICCVCGKPAEVHHYESIGMGGDRTEVDDSDNLVLPLCRSHHTESHTVGRESFTKKYHIAPVRRR